MTFANRRLMAQAVVNYGVNCMCSVIVRSVTAISRYAQRPASSITGTTGFNALLDTRNNVIETGNGEISREFENDRFCVEKSLDFRNPWASLSATNIGSDLWPGTTGAGPSRLRGRRRNQYTVPLPPEG